MVDITVNFRTLTVQSNKKNEIMKHGAAEILKHGAAAQISIMFFFFFTKS